MAKKIKEIPFEESLLRLEQIVDQMEEGQINLDDSLKRYEEAMSLIRHCQDKLQNAEKKIELLQKNKDGSLNRTEIAIEDLEDASSDPGSMLF